MFLFGHRDRMWALESGRLECKSHLCFLQRVLLWRSVSPSLRILFLIYRKRLGVLAVELTVELTVKFCRGCSDSTSMSFLAASCFLVWETVESKAEVKGSGPLEVGGLTLLAPLRFLLSLKFCPEVYCPLGAARVGMMEGGDEIAKLCHWLVGAPGSQGIKKTTTKKPTKRGEGLFLH